MTRRAKRRRNVALTPAQKAANLVDDALHSAAEAEYQAAKLDYESRMVGAEADFDARLRVPANNVALGLPPDLPEHTIEILRRTQALDIVGPTLPNREKIYARHGLTAPRSVRESVSRAVEQCR